MRKTFTTLLAVGMLMMSTSAMALSFNSGYTLNNSPLWTLTDQATSTTSGFSLYFENASYESDFGLFNVNSVINPTEVTDKLQIFAYNNEPYMNASVKFQYNVDHWEASLNGVAPWKDFDPIFGFYFGVHTNPVSQTVDYTYYTVTSLNNPDAGLSHIAVGYRDTDNTAYVYLEDLPFAGADFDYNDMKVYVSDVAPAPVPEPGTMMLLGIGMLGMAVYGKRRMNK